MFAYEVLSEEQAMNERFQLLPPGEYDAVVEASVDKVSANSGNPMMDITLSVYDEQGKPHSVRDFLVFTKAMMWKVVHFAQSSGLSHQYSNGQLCSNIAQGKNVRVKIGVEEGRIIPEDKLQGKLVGSKYPDKNKVEDYIKSERTPAQSSQGNYTRPPMQSPPVHDSEDVPF